jgi:peptidoglycan LD-endopeptidase LytH
MLRRATSMLLLSLAAGGCGAGTTTAAPSHPAGPIASTTAPVPTVTPPPGGPGSPTAAPTPTAPAASSSPKPSPATAERYVYPVQRCGSTYSSSHHDYPAADIFTQRGCAFVAVTSGTVDEVTFTDRWNPQVDAGATRGGRSVSIVGDDGVRYYGSHLLRIAAGIRPGVKVRTGRLLGLIDNAGDARYTATHVHFGLSWPTRHGLWWIRRGEVWPQPLPRRRGPRDRTPARPRAALPGRVLTSADVRQAADTWACAAGRCRLR